MTFQTRFIDSSRNNFETRLLVISLIRHIPFRKNIIRIGQTVSAVFGFGREGLILSLEKGKMLRSQVKDI